MSLPPASISHPLFVYLGNDGNIWAVNSADGRGYCIGVANSEPGVQDAPADGATYVRQDQGWAPVQVPAQQLVITNIQPTSAVEASTVTLTVNGSGFTPTSVINWAGYPISTTYVDAQTLTGQFNLGPGSAGIYTVVVTDQNQQSNSVAFTVNPAGKVFSNAFCQLTINSDGDLILTQSQGPNAGKSVNLTYGKWS
jgi:hypothetical protein